MGRKSRKRDDQLRLHLQTIRPFYLKARKGLFNPKSYFENLVQSSFAKAYELVELIAKSNCRNAFFYIAGLRGICEDIIVLSFMSDQPAVWRQEVAENLMGLELLENLEIQRQFFSVVRPFQQIVGPGRGHEARKQQYVLKLQTLWGQLPNGWTLNRSNTMPQIRQIAERSGLETLYDYIYRITCDMVHFNPQVLIRAGWGKKVELKPDVPTVMRPTFSFANFHRYYQMYGEVYGSFLLILHFELLGKFLAGDASVKKHIKELREWMFELIRWPEVITHEELNLEPPSHIIRIITRMIHEEKNPKNPKSVLAALRSVKKPQGA